jgi:hypothetical protein
VGGQGKPGQEVGESGEEERKKGGGSGRIRGSDLVSAGEAHRKQEDSVAKVDAFPLPDNDRCSPLTCSPLRPLSGSKAKDAKEENVGLPSASKDAVTPSSRGSPNVRLGRDIGDCEENGGVNECKTRGLSRSLMDASGLLQRSL